MTGIISIIGALWALGVSSGLAYSAIKCLKAHTKNKNLLMFETWAEQEVAAATGKTTNVKEAQDNLLHRIDENGLAGHFGENQILGAIKSATSYVGKEK